MTDHPLDDSESVGATSEAGVDIRLARAAARARQIREARASVAVATSRPVAVGGATRTVECLQCSGPVTQTYLSMGRDLAGWKPDPPKCEDCRGITAIEQAKEAERLRRESEALEQRRSYVREQFVIPWKYQESQLGGFRKHGTTEEQHRQSIILGRAHSYVLKWPRRQDRSVRFPMIVIMMGRTGTGKTDMSFAIGRAVMEQYTALVRRVKFPDLVRQIQLWYERHEKLHESAVLAQYREADLLIVDECSRHALVGDISKKQKHVYDIVDWRDENGLPTIMTTNEAKDEGVSGTADEVFGNTILDRAEAYSGFWHFDWPSYRKVIGQEARGAIKEDVKEAAKHLRQARNESSHPIVVSDHEPGSEPTPT